jgi:hypothetical protein
VLIEGLKCRLVVRRLSLKSGENQETEQNKYDEHGSTNMRMH